MATFWRTDNCNTCTICHICESRQNNIINVINRRKQPGMIQKPSPPLGKGECTLTRIDQDSAYAAF